MRHCCEFDAFDIWYLKDCDDFTNRTLFIGECPICHKHVSLLYQKNINTNVILSIKKVGEASITFTKELIKHRLYSRNSINKMNLKPKPYGWRFGVNKEKFTKNGQSYVYQYAVDFYGNSEFIKKCN